MTDPNLAELARDIVSVFKRLMDLTELGFPDEPTAGHDKPQGRAIAIRMSDVEEKAPCHHHVINLETLICTKCGMGQREITKRGDSRTYHRP